MLELMNYLTDATYEIVWLRVLRVDDCVYGLFLVVLSEAINGRDYLPHGEGSR